MVFTKIFFQNRYVALETPSRPPPLHGENHLKFPFWLFEPFPNYGFCYFNAPFSFQWKLWPKIYYFFSLSLTRPSIASFAQFYQGMVNIWQSKYQEGNGQSLVHPTVRLLLLYAWNDSRIACTYNCLCVQLFIIQGRCAKHVLTVREWF